MKDRPTLPHAAPTNLTKTAPGPSAAHRVLGWLRGGRVSMRGRARFGAVGAAVLVARVLADESET